MLLLSGLEQGRITLTYSPEEEVEREIEVKVRIPTYGTQAQRYRTAQRIKNLLETALHAEVNTEIKHGKEWHPVEKLAYRKVN